MKKTATILAVCLLAGCSLADEQQSKDIALLRAELFEAKAQAETNRRGLIDANNRIQELSNGNNAQWGWADPAAGPSYTRIQTNLAPLLVSFENAEPVGDSTRALLQIGNMTSATFTGAKLTVRYNRRMPTEGSQVAAWNDSMRTTSVELTERILPGSWTTVRVSLPGIKPEELGHLAFKADLNMVVLNIR